METARELNRRLRGRRIVKVKLNLFDGADRARLFEQDNETKPREMRANSEIFLDDGTVIRFHVEESDCGDYGVRLVLSNRTRKEATRTK